MKAKTFLNRFRLENFKAIQKSGGVKFTPLTVLIGNNGSGKSSLIEGLETYRSIVIDGLDTAMQRWFGMDHIWSKRVRHKIIGLGLANETYENPIRFSVSGRTAPRHVPGKHDCKHRAWSKRHFHSRGVCRGSGRG